MANNCINLTSENIINLSKYMFGLAQLTPVMKSSKWYMRALGKILAFFNIISKNDWDRISITLINKCFLTFEIGTKRKSFVTQIATIGHECQHGFQQTKNKIRFNFKYIFSSKFRMLQEVEAYITTIELYYNLLNVIFIPNLKFYFLRKELVKEAEKLIEEATDRILNGEIITKSGKLVLDYIKNI